MNNYFVLSILFTIFGSFAWSIMNHLVTSSNASFVSHSICSQQFQMILLEK